MIGKLFQPFISIIRLSCRCIFGEKIHKKIISWHNTLVFIIVWYFIYLIQCAFWFSAFIFKASRYRTTYYPWNYLLILFVKIFILFIRNLFIRFPRFRKNTILNFFYKEWWKYLWWFFKRLIWNKGYVYLFILREDLDKTKQTAIGLKKSLWTEMKR